MDLNQTNEPDSLMRKWQRWINFRPEDYYNDPDESFMERLKESNPMEKTSQVL